MVTTGQGIELVNSLLYVPTLILGGAGILLLILALFLSWFYQSTEGEGK